MKQIAIVILNWNGQKLLKQFLPSLFCYTPMYQAEIIVVDNGSTDDSINFLKLHYPEITIHALPENYGFAKGYNHALIGLKHRYVVLLNSDVEVTYGWLQTAFNYLEHHPEVSALQPKILSYNNKSRFEYAGACGGFIDKNGYPFCRGRIFNTIEQDNGQYEEPIPIFWASGACMFIRLKDYKEAGGLDEAFFAHQEEIDLCWRLNARGKKIVCLPQSVVYHVGGATLKKENSKKTYLNFRNNLLMIYKNMPESKYTRTMTIRRFWDYLSVLHFILKGQIANAKAVVKAYKDFKKMKKQYKNIRTINEELRSIDFPETILQESLIWKYYFKNKKRFDLLINNPSIHTDDERNS
ncbi:MAG: glycosyltransferase family 2 protein [Candidatus Symbiothrix sp.]|jgi:GT2 family glycosyltransferase|nr:glycosyltransferase family 2 protein [Candidatus Symbiothrix sp.]